jgi:hypothetical protein
VTTFDLAEVRSFTATLDARIEQCDNGEGMLCANLDDTLLAYARLCCEFHEKVRQWGRAVFSGQVAFDPEVENHWLNEGNRLFDRASQLWDYGQEMHGECFVLEHGAALGSSLWRLQRMLLHWVTPKLAVAPLARHGMPLTAADRAEAQTRINSLPPLPADWQPSDPRRRPIFQKLKRRRPA